MKLSLDDDAEADDPILAVVNLIDVLLVIIAALLLSVASNPLNAYGKDRIVVIRNAGRPDMEIVIKDGAHLQRFQSDGAAGQGKGVKAGVAYRMADGSLVYVPE